MLWVLKRTVSVRRFFGAPKTYVKHDELGNIYNYMLQIFTYLNLCDGTSVPLPLTDVSGFAHACSSYLSNAFALRQYKITNGS